jgi:uncharacterized protein (TIGR02452 family)
MSPPIADFTDLVVPVAFALFAVAMTSTNRFETPPPAYRERAPFTNSGWVITSAPSDDPRRSALKRIAEETLKVIREGHYIYKGVNQDLTVAVKEAKSKTVYHSPNSSIKHWASSTKPHPGSSPTHISILHITTLDAARLLENVYRSNPSEGGKTGVLNFASATKPGGGFKNGAEAQEESITRSSTLYPALEMNEAQQFYKLHTRESAENAVAYYSHGMIYSPNISIFRDDDGNWTYPFPVDVLSCAAVNAGEVRKELNVPISSGLEVGIEKEMSERMGRILYLFEKNGVRNIILGTFGTGVFRNNIATVARIWAHLLLVPEARFKDSFDRIIFAISGEETFAEFQSAFDAWGQTRASGLGESRSSNRRSNR